MYISRSGLEEKLVRALDQAKHIVVHGESGCGKSWLYKKVFRDKGVYFRTANLGRANHEGGIAGLLAQVLAKEDDSALSQITEKLEAGVGVPLFKAGMQSERKYTIRAGDGFETLLAAIRKSAGTRTAALVFENLEHIVGDDALLKEFKGLLLLVDDEEYAKHSVRLLLVTTASDLRSYLAKLQFANTITNRLHEIPEVARLAPRQAAEFVQRGLFALLGIRVIDNDEELRAWIIEWILHFSDRIPQYLHEICLEVAQASEASGRVISKESVKSATLDWLRSSLVSEMTTVTSNLNAKATKKGRRNQLLFAIAHCEDPEFDYLAIERLVRKHFPEACEGVKLNASQGLSDLASSKHPLIRKAPQGTAYRIIDPRFRILMRWVLVKSAGSEGLFIRPFDAAISL